MAAKKPKKPKFNDLADDQALDLGLARPVNFDIQTGDAGGGGNARTGGIVRLFFKVNKFPFQQISTLTDHPGQGADTQTVTVRPFKGKSHSIRVLVWDRKNGERPANLGELHTNKVRFRVRP
jgi:hypothetical protein